jgi:6-phosphogluconate dehydrogenase
MQIASFGLGKMGSQIARRLQKHGFEVLAWNRSAEPRDEVAKSGVKVFADVGELIVSLDQQLSVSPEALSPARQAGGTLSPGGESNNVAFGAIPRIFWLMLPHTIVDEFLQSQLGQHLKSGDIVVDGGNSFYKDSIRRAANLQKKGVVFYDCGTSGGVWGFDNGFALMVGGPKEQWPIVEPIFKTLSAGENYGLLGKNGAGHFVKMVHNGMEYGMMEAIAEGYGVLKASDFDLDLTQVTKIYQQGSVVRSWLIDLAANIFVHEDVDATSGVIAATGEGEWTVNTGKELGVDVRVIEDSLKVRQESVDPKNAQKYSNKIVALLRKQFGGHGVMKK